MKTVHAAVFAALLLFSVPVTAEIYNCGGKWTNKPCGKGSRAVDLPRLSRGGTFTDRMQSFPPNPGSAASIYETEASADGEELKLTRLRKVGDLTTHTEQINDLRRLMAAAVALRNCGEAPAMDVKVEVEVVGRERQRLPLAGPSVIERGRTARYQLLEPALIEAEKRFALRISCRNCRDE